MSLRSPRSPSTEEANVAARGATVSGAGGVGTTPQARETSPNSTTDEKTAASLEGKEGKERRGNTEPMSIADAGVIDVESQAPAAPAAPAGPKPQDFPDGGRPAWIVVGGGWCCMFTSLGWINCIGVFQTQYEHDQLRSYSSSAIAWILSMQTFVMFGGAPFFGKVFDNYGPRVMLPIGVFLHVFGLMMTSLGSKYYQLFLAQSIVSGVGASIIFYSSTNSIATWFSKKRAAALGLASSGSAVGGVVVPIMFNHLNTRVGFGWALRSVAFVYLGLLIIAIATVNTRLKPKPKPWNIMDFINPFKELRFVLVSTACFTFFLAVFLPTNFVILQALSEGMSLRLSGYLLAILNATSFFGRIFAGLLADKIGRFNCMIIATSASAVFVFALWLPSSGNAPIIVYAAVAGFFGGAFVAMVPACVAQISDIRQIGVRNGSNFFIVSLAALIGNPIAGALISADHGKFRDMQIFCGVAMFASVAFFTGARVVQVGFKPAVKC